MEEFGSDSPQPTTNVRVVMMVRRASTVLKVGAVVLAVASLVSAYLTTTTDLNQFYGGETPKFPFKVKLMQFLQSAVPNVGWAALVYASAYALLVAAARLETQRLPPVNGIDETSASTPPPAPSTTFVEVVTPHLSIPLVSNDDSIWRP